MTPSPPCADLPRVNPGRSRTADRQLGRLPDGPARRLALVTGASSGIGAAFARALSRRGHPLVLVARSRPALEELAATLPTDAAVVAADLTTPDGLTRVERALRTTRPPVRLLVNNAGSTTYGAFADRSADELERSVLLNTVAPTRLMAVGMRAMPPDSGILNISSTAAGREDPRLAVYAASKSYLDILTRAVRHEARDCGIELTLVRPGRTRTAFHARAGEDTAGLPAHRWQSAEDVVEAALAAHERRDPEITVAPWSPAA